MQLTTINVINTSHLLVHLSSVSTILQITPTFYIINILPLGISNSSRKLGKEHSHNKQLERLIIIFNSYHNRNWPKNQSKKYHVIVWKYDRNRISDDWWSPFTSIGAKVRPPNTHLFRWFHFLFWLLFGILSSSLLLLVSINWNKILVFYMVYHQMIKWFYLVHLSNFWPVRYPFLSSFTASFIFV